MIKLFSSKSDSPSDTSKKKKVSSHPYYHYYLPSEEVENVLHQPGEFLVRETIREDKRVAVVLSVFDGKRKKIIHSFIEFNVDDSLFYLDPNVGKASIPELIEFHRIKGIPVQGCVLKTAIERNKWEVLDNRMKFDDIFLGQGNFATVHRGQFLTTQEKKWLTVAYKRLRVENIKTNTDRDNAKKSILREFQIGRKLQGHPRILNVYGLYVGSEALAMIMEFCDGGALNAYLKKSKGDVPIYAKLNFLLHAAEGLAHMHSRKLIHRDIAARNFLMVKRDKENHVPMVKVSDFGLTREGPVYVMKVPHEIPPSICAIESLEDVNPEWTYKTDTWSFGLLMYEVFDECQTEPYHHIMAPDTQHLRDALRSGYRAVVPESMPKDCRPLMEKCFLENPNDRPTMTEIVAFLPALIQKYWKTKIRSTKR